MMQKEQEQPRQHSLDNFVRWSQEIVKGNQQKGVRENEKKEIKEKADLLRSGHSELGGLPNLAGQV